MQSENKSKTMLILCASGLVGSFVLEQLLINEKVKLVYAPTRRKLLIENVKLVNPVVDFNVLDSWEDFLKVDCCFCCLGTTIKSAGSKEAFRRIDQELVVKIAQKIFSYGCQEFAVISSVGANPYSSNFYLKTKGQMELDLAKIGFKKLEILNPSLLVGQREDVRRLESIGQSIMPFFDPLLIGPLKKYKTVKGKDLAIKMIKTLGY